MIQLVAPFCAQRDFEHILKKRIMVLTRALPTSVDCRGKVCYSLYVSQLPDLTFLQKGDAIYEIIHQATESLQRAHTYHHPQSFNLRIHAT